MTDPARPAFRAIDPHIHLVDLSTGLYPHFADRPPGAPFSRSYLLGDFLAEAQDGPQIVGAVHVEAFPADPVAETAVIDRIAAKAPFDIVMVGNADLLAEDFEAVLDRHAAFPVFRGIRQVVNIHPNPAYSKASVDLLNAPGFVRSMRSLGRRGHSFDMQLLGHQMARCAEVAGECPETQIVVNHAGLWTDRTPDGWKVWKDGLRGLARQDNVTIKVSGLGMRDAGWTVESIRPVVYEVIEAFGTDRVMFASNFPVDKTWSGYARLWQAFDELTAGLTETERGRLFEATARRVYRI